MIPKLIDVNAELCVNCHACIAVCPVKFCNDGSGDHVTINEESCIGCGRCLAACTHNARKIVDDLEPFLEAARGRVPLIALIAPSVVAGFPGRSAQLIGWLRSIGVSAVFDVSFGAEMTVQSYAAHLRDKNPKCMISSACPAVVSYIRLYQPELIPFVVPYDSPILHLLKMVHTEYPRYRDHRSVIISPCLAKKREFVLSGFGDFNVTMARLKDYFKKQRICLADYPAGDYDQPPAGEGAVFSSPGGMMDNMERLVPGIAAQSRQIEGDAVYRYLKQLPEALAHGTAPLLIDCLSCEKGCNGGPGSGAEEVALDVLDSIVAKRRAGLIDKPLAKTREDTVDLYGDPARYSRKIVSLSERTGLKEPSDAEVEKIFREMLKDGDADILNCTACGYRSCRGMAKAIFNGLNRIENCHKYLQKKMCLEHSDVLDATRLFQDVFELSNEAIILADNRQIIDCNQMAGDLFGYSREELIGSLPGRLFYNQSFCGRCLGEGEGEKGFEWTLLRADGSLFPAKLQVSHLSIHGEAAVQIHVWDVSEQKRAESELKAARDEAEQASLAKSEFLANMSHEIRTPMNGVMGIADLLMSEPLKDHQHEMVGDIVYSANNLLDVINNILDLSRIEARKMVLESLPFSPVQLVEGAVRMMDSLAAQNGSELEVHFDSEMPDCLLGDSSRFRQVIVNLVGNSIKFTPQGRVVLTLQAKRLIETDICRLDVSVRDTGIGISSEKLPLIFDKFVQADLSTTRNYGGTGLGLAITRELVVLMGGDIEVSSQLGIGTEFSFYVHLQCPKKGSVRVKAGDCGAAGGRQEFQEVSVLLVEDNRINQKVIGRMLQGYGCTVEIAENGELALICLLDTRFDLVFMDCSMPVMDGFEATRQIRNRLKLPDLPVIAITAHAMMGDDQRCYDAGMNGYVSKPVKHGDLLKVLREYCPAPAVAL